jgi:aryl-alcohol dehydrogenase-like predicted oxidoreductase
MDLKNKNRVGLGTFPLAGVFKEINAERAKGVVRKYINGGGYYIHTAPLYGFGEVEKLVGDVLSEFSRDSFYISTMCGYVDVEGKTFQTVQKSSKYDDVIRECDKSLKRLKVDYIDLYFVHCVDPNTPFDETVRALTQLQSDGKIREIGVSNVNLAELKEYNQTGKINFIQNRLSLINRSINQEFEKYLLDNKIGLVPYQVIDRGQLTGSVIDGIKLREGDLRAAKLEWKDEQYNLIANWTKTNLLPIAKKLNITLGQLSVAWALHQPYLGFAIIGVTNPEYIPINLASDRISLTRETLTEIETAYLLLETEIKNKFNLSIREFRGFNEKFY